MRILQLNTSLKVIYHPLYGMNNYYLIWGDWLSCDPLRGSHDSQSPHIRAKTLVPHLVATSIYLSQNKHENTYIGISNVSSTFSNQFPLRRLNVVGIFRIALNRHRHAKKHSPNHGSGSYTMCGCQSLKQAL